MTAFPPRQRAFEALFRPRSVAIVGASATPFKQGNVAIKYLIAGGYAGAVYPVNPSGGEIEGLRAWPSILDIPGEVDCALFVIPAGATIAAVRQCAEKGVRAIIVGSNGFAEQGTDEGRARQRDLEDIARRHGILLLGPNTNGVWNASANFSLGYNTSHGDPMIPGPVSIAAHSGALFNSIAPALAEFGARLSKFVPVGNEADVDMLDVLEFFIGDDETRVIGLLMEGVRDGARLRDLARRARAAGKPVVALKLGRSEAGAGAALAHSSRLAGSARAYDALLRDSGVLRVRSIEALAGACALLAGGLPSRGGANNDLVCVSTTGGGAELLADHAADFRLALAGAADGSWDGEAARLIATFTGAGLVRNPVDGGNLGDWTRLEQLFKTLEGEGRSGPVLFFAHMLPQERRDLAVAEMLLRRRERTGAPLVCVAPGGMRDSVKAFYAARKAPVFRDTGACFAALRCYYDALEFSAPDDAPPRLDAERAAQARALLDAAAGADILTEIDSAEILRAAGVPIVESAVARTPGEAREALRAAGGPVVLKGVAPGVAHKNDAGLVVTSIASADAMDRAHAAIERALAALGAPRDACSLVAQKMLPSRVEFIAGVTHEPPLGHFLVFGLGGLLAEALDEVLLISMPASATAISAILEKSRIGALTRRLDAGAASPFSARRAIVDALLALQALTLEFPELVRSIDVNPLIVGADHCTAVDALIELRAERPET